MEEIGRVKIVKAGRATVEIKPNVLCGGCSQKAGCATLFASGGKMVEAKNKIGAKEGDWVKLTFVEKKELFSSLLLFGLPTIFLIVGVSFFNFWGGILGIVFAFFLLRLINIFFDKRGLFLPSIAEVVDSQEEEK
ncbi:MAG: SoxR reducing system RseC family protein [candidate division WOR-3 bacterium]